MQDCVFGLQVHTDGRVWVCINGSTFLRFKPNGKAITDE
jgi:sugar lactone lactonase YvrE